MKILRFIYFAVGIMIACVSCIRQCDVEVTQTFCVENQTNDTWFVHEVVSWGGESSLQVGPLQTDSVSHYFKLKQGGAIMPIFAPPVTLDYWYTRKGCWIETQLINQNTQECYEWRERVLPFAYQSLEWPHFWNYVGEEREIRSTDYHTYKCVINQELLDSLRQR